MSIKKDKDPSGKAKFAMAFHCYQPVFNLGGEIERAYKCAYEPLLATLDDFPGVKATFHFSGNMLEWFEDRHPGYLEKAKKMTDRGQIEIMGGGCFEPVMALIPESDRIEQLKMSNDLISRIFGAEPRGAWIAEKVWEPGLVDTLTSSGAEYTIVDDYHLFRAGLEESRIYGPCATGGKTSELVLFPSLTRLRYYMPFRPPKATLDYMKWVRDRRGSGETCFFFADDGEKFGAWPCTYKWVHEKGWLRDFFGLLNENSRWLETLTYSEIMENVSPERVGEVPASSYAEMMEWSEGDFRNFLKKYPEADRMHRRMISVSETLRKMEAGAGPEGEYPYIAKAKRELFKAQANCAYWHGTFGGVYLPHLRSGVYEHLIRAQNHIDRSGCENTPISAVERDYGPGKRETVLRNGIFDVHVSSAGGAVKEIDHKPLNVNLGNTMSRTSEGYHRKLAKGYSARIKEARRAVLRGDFIDVHDLLGVGERGLAKVLRYDDYQRASFLTHVLSEKRPWKDMQKFRGSIDSFLKGQYSSITEVGSDSISQALSRRDKVFVDNGRPLDLEIVKKITMGRGPSVEFSHGIRKHSGGNLRLRYAIEFNFLVWDKTVVSRPKMARADNLFLRDMHSGVGIDFRLEKEADVFTYPVFTVNETESGLRKTFQGISVLFGDEFMPSGYDNKREMNITISVRW